MAKKGKAMAAVAVRVPQSREEAQTMLADYGTALRNIEALETQCNQELADIKEGYVAKARPFNAEAEALFKGLHLYCDANRATITDNNKVKTVDFGTGKVSWRWNPASVKLRGKAEDIIVRIRNLGDDYLKFLRATVEVNRVAILNDPNLAKNIKGVTIDSAGETFTVEPFSDEQLAESA